MKSNITHTHAQLHHSFVRSSTRPLPIFRPAPAPPHHTPRLSSPRRSSRTERHLGGHVRRDINRLRQLCDGDLKPRLDRLEDLSILISISHIEAISAHVGRTKQTCTREQTSSDDAKVIASPLVPKRPACSSQKTRDGFDLKKNMRESRFTHQRAAVAHAANAVKIRIR